MKHISSFVCILGVSDVVFVAQPPLYFVVTPFCSNFAI